jgi:hypothetical protein
VPEDDTPTLEEWVEVLDRVQQLEATVWTLFCAVRTARDIVPPREPCGVLLKVIQEHTQPVAESTLPTRALAAA